MEPLHFNFKKNISNLSEKEFTDSIVIPFIEKIHPGIIEYTHSSIEGGRDIVSIGADSIDRHHILCVQVKTTKISYGSSSFGSLSNTACVAKETGVILHDGRKAYPNEIYVITSKEFPENDRRQVEDQLANMSKKNIKIIALEELTKLLMKNLPEIIVKYSNQKDVKIINLIDNLSKHQESRAFGLHLDKFIDEFYVPITIAPYAYYAQLALENYVNLEQAKICIRKKRSIKNIVEEDEDIEKQLDFRKYLIDKIKDYHNKTFLIDNQEDSIKIISKVTIKGNFKHIEMKYKATKIACDEEMKLLWSRYESNKKFAKDAKDAMDNRMSEIKDQIKKIKIEYTIEYDLFTTLTKAIKSVNTSIIKCTKVLGKNVESVKNAHGKIKILNDLVERCVKNIFFSIKDSAILCNEILRISVREPLNLINLNDLVLIEGPPGSGKTTFLRVLAILSLEAGLKLIYIPCASISDRDCDNSLIEIAKKHSEHISNKVNDFNHYILILDGLDEAPFDLSEKILNGRKYFNKVILSCRIAHKTSIKDVSFNIGLALFSKNDRDLFFSRWFNENKECLHISRYLITKYPDIDEHTKLPLIATVAAALIQNGFEPTTKNEIYDYRLNLLLSKWDRYRGIERMRVDDPKGKRRFLRQLAYTVHSMPHRRRKFDITKIQEAYENALGNWGYKHNFDDVIHDLILCGVLIEEGNKTYTFGHLSFQEHLAAEYLHEKNLSFSNISFKLQDDWWSETLIFYASIKGDLTDFLNFIDLQDGIFIHNDVLKAMVRHAPYTHPGAIQVIHDEWFR